MRIASLLASSTEILHGIGLTDSIVAISHECDFPESILNLPRVTVANISASATSQAIDDEVKEKLASGAALYEIDQRLLARLKPDVIITQAQCDVCAVRYEDVVATVANSPELQDTTIVSLNPMTLEDIFLDIIRVGEATNSQDAAEGYRADLQERVANVQAKTAHLPQKKRPRVALVEWVQPLMLSGNWMPEMVQLAGGSHELTAGGRHSPYIAWEQICDYNPEILVILPCGFDLQRTIAESQLLPQLPGWDKLAAVENRRVYAVDGNAYFNRSGPRIVDSLEILAHLIHPQWFAAPAAVSQPENVWTRLDTENQQLVKVL